MYEFTNMSLQYEFINMCDVKLYTVFYFDFEIILMLRFVRVYFES